MKPDWSYDIIAPFYDSDMGLNMPFDDIAGYLHLLPEAPARILEVGCGTGRLTIPLADHGYSVTAIDRSRPMLEGLRHKLLSNHDIETFHMDARQMCLDGQFDAVLFGYCGFQYLLTDLDISLFCKRVREILTSNGSLVLDVFLHRPTSESNAYVLDYTRDLADGRLLSRHRQLTVNKGVSHTRRQYTIQSHTEKQQIRTESRQLLYSDKSLVARLQRHGFMLDEEVFDYDRHNCDPACSHRFYTARFTPLA